MIPRQRRRHDESGAVAIIVALSLTFLLIVTAMTLDFGLARFDRQQTKRAADSAVMAGLRAADGGTDQVFTWRGVCGALDFLKANDSDLAGLADGACGSPSTTATCNKANPNDGNAAVYTGTASANGVTSTVTIKSPYVTSDGGFAVENLDSVKNDKSASAGCDQLAVIVRKSRKPGLGSLATSGQLVFTQRSVGRVSVGDGDLAPALLLLERTRCQVLTNGSSGPGNTSKIWIYGSGATPASVHSDSDASDTACASGSNKQLIAGNKANAIVAYGSPASGESGIISTFATLTGRAADIVSDGTGNVFGTTAATETGLPGAKQVLAGRNRVGRYIVDERYLPGVTTAVRGAYSEWQKDHASPAGYTTRLDCIPNNGPARTTYLDTLANMTISDSVYIDCPGNSGITMDAVIGAGKIYFHGFIKGGNIRMPNATQVYVDNTDNSSGQINGTSAISLGGGDGFCMRAASCTSFAVDTCSSGVTGTSVHGRLFIRRGALSSSGGSTPGLLRLCNTTVYMGGDQLGAGTAASPGACLPTTWGTLPTTSPCAGAPSGSPGNGYLQLSGATDWTAPNRYGAMTDAEKQPAWDDGEDLALWDETYAVDPDFKMAGGASLNVSGVFMIPNAFPIVFSGNALFDLRDAQFITRSFAVDGGAQLLMSVDPNNAIHLPKLDKFTLVR